MGVKQTQIMNKIVKLLLVRKNPPKLNEVPKMLMMISTVRRKVRLWLTIARSKGRIRRRSNSTLKATLKDSRS